MKTDFLAKMDFLARSMLLDQENREISGTNSPLY